MTLAWAIEKPWRLPQTGLCILCTLASQAMPLAVLVVAQSELVKAKARGQSVMTWHLGGLSLQDLGHQEPTNCLNKSYTNSVWKSQNVFLVIGLKHICIHVPNSYLKVTSGFPPPFLTPPRSGLWDYIIESQKHRMSHVLKSWITGHPAFGLYLSAWLLVEQKLKPMKNMFPEGALTVVVSFINTSSFWKAEDALAGSSDICSKSTKLFGKMRLTRGKVA